MRSLQDEDSSHFEHCNILAIVYKFVESNAPVMMLPIGQGFTSYHKVCLWYMEMRKGLRVMALLPKMCNSPSGLGIQLPFKKKCRTKKKKQKENVSILCDFHFY